jgi:hypothetical protein
MSSAISSAYGLGGSAALRLAGGQKVSPTELGQNIIQIGQGTLLRKLSGPARTGVELAMSLLNHPRVSGRFSPAGIPDYRYIHPEFNPPNPPGERNILAAAQARKDPLLNVFWYCDLPPIDGVFLPWEYVEDATLPYMEVEQSSVYRAGKMYHYAGHYSLGTLSLKLYEDSAGISLRYLDAWSKAIINRNTGLYGNPKKYKKIINFAVLDVSNLTAFFLEYSGCFRMRADPLNLGSGPTERIITSAEFSVDDVLIKFGPFEPGAIPSIVLNVGKDFPQSLTALPTTLPSAFTNFSSSVNTSR